MNIVMSIGILVQFQFFTSNIFHLFICLIDDSERIFFNSTSQFYIVRIVIITQITTRYYIIHKSILQAFRYLINPFYLVIQLSSITSVVFQNRSKTLHYCNLFSSTICSKVSMILRFPAIIPFTNSIKLVDVKRYFSKVSRQHVDIIILNFFQYPIVKGRS